MVLFHMKNSLVLVIFKNYSNGANKAYIGLNVRHQRLFISVDDGCFGNFMFENKINFLILKKFFP